MKFYAHEAVDARYVEVLPLGSDNSELISGFMDRVHNHVWYGTYGSPARIVKFDAATRDVVNSTTLRPGEDQVWSAVGDPTGTFGYFGTRTSPGKIVKVRLTDAQRVNVLTLEPGEDDLFAAVIDPAGEFAYFVAAPFSATCSLVKVRLSNFTRVAALPMNAGENTIGGIAIDPQNEFIYMALGSNPTKLAKIRISDFTRVDTLNSSSDFVGGIAMDTTGSFLYALGGFQAPIFEPRPPGIVERIRLSDFTSPGPNLTLNSDETSPGPIGVTPDGAALLVVCNDSPAKIIKIDLPSFIRADTEPLPSTLGGSIRCLPIDAASQFAFPAVWSTPGRIITYENTPKPLRLGLYIDLGESQNFDEYHQLLWQSQPIALTQDEKWVSVSINQGIPSTLNLVPGSYTLAWQCDADEAVPSHSISDSQRTDNQGAGIQLGLDYGPFPQTLKPNYFPPDFDDATSWTTTASRWSMYLDYTSRNSVKEWQKLE